MTLEELFTELVATCPAPGDTVYVARRGDDYQWRALPEGEPVLGPTPGDELPDAWLYHTSRWPTDGDPTRERAYFDDLIAEMDSMTGGPDRCRWDLDDPYYHGH